MPNFAGVALLMLTALVTIAAVVFLVGGIPFGYVLTRAAGLGDLRAIGSGSIGATNVLRTGRKDIALATLLLDAGKGVLAVYVGWQVGDGVGDGVPIFMGALFGVIVVAGHCHSIWLKGRGGKGVATGVGVLALIAWPAALACCAVWMLVAWRSRMSSAGSLAAIAVGPVAALAWGGWEPGLAALLIAADIAWRHRGNIQRLRAGTEPRIGSRA